MKVSEALENRISVRAFTDQPVDVKTIADVFEKAARAPSGGNVQPWRIVVLEGNKLEEFRSRMEDILARGNSLPPEDPEYHVYPPNLKEPYRSARFEVGEDMYALLGIPRDDKPARLEWLANNFRFFGAPAAAFCFIERIMGPPQWSDMGMFLQSAMLLFQEHGIDTCAQEFWARYPKTVSEFCEIGDDWMLFCGLAIGYREEKHPVNRLRTKRLDPKHWLSVL